jgi:hypothetical protein
MKTLITTLAVLTLSFAALSAKEGTFTSVIIPDGGANPLQIDLKARQWMKITNFTQNDTGTPVDQAGVAVLKGDSGLWVLFATNPLNHSPHEDVFVAGPATVLVSHVTGSTVFLTYERGSD